MDLNLNVTLLACDARSYYDAYEVLQEKTTQPASDMNLSTPALVCLAFSIELHVKLLLRTYDLNPWGHHIGKLMEKLPKDEMTCISTHPDFDHTQQREGFFENINMASDLFIRTRYYFENLGTLHFNTGFCLTLAIVIRQRIVKRVPYLSDYLGVF